MFITINNQIIKVPKDTLIGFITVKQHRNHIDNNSLSGWWHVVKSLHNDESRIEIDAFRRPEEALQLISDISEQISSIKVKGSKHRSTTLGDKQEIGVADSNIPGRKIFKDIDDYIYFEKTGEIR